MPGPADYDNIDMNIQPNVMFSAANIGIPMEADFIAGYVQQVSDLWSSLKIGWVGTTAQEAQDFNDRWQKSMVELFGRQNEDPSQPIPAGENVLGRIATAVYGAAANFSWADQNVVDLFGGFKKSDGTPPPDPNAPAPHSDVTETGPGSG